VVGIDDPSNGVYACVRQHLEVDCGVSALGELPTRLSMIPSCDPTWAFRPAGVNRWMRLLDAMFRSTALGANVAEGVLILAER
jgi:hypothetical protein